MVSSSARAESIRIYSASEAAERLGVSVGMLRRYALAYEQLGREIFVDPQQGRRYTDEQVEVLERACGFVQANPGMSVEDGVTAALGGDERVLVKPPPMPGEMAVREAVTNAVRPLLEEALTPLLERMTALEAENRALREQMQALPKSTPTPAEDPGRLSLLERRNAYLEGELKRRDSVEKPQRRSWWPWRGRGRNNE